MLREDFMTDYSLSVSGLAKALGVSRQTVNELLRERRSLSPEMALRLGRLFGNSPDVWLNAQRAVDLWEAEQAMGDQVGPIRTVKGGDRPAAKVHLDPSRLADFCRRHNVLQLAVFGSAVRDDFGPASDLDILVAFVPGSKVSLFDLVDMADELGQLAGRRVDLVPVEGLKQRIRDSVLESSQVIYAAA
jgi:addiction module HigA family antidote